jgi:hypothetical protein
MINLYQIPISIRPSCVIGKLQQHTAQHWLSSPTRPQFRLDQAMQYPQCETGCINYDKIWHMDLWWSMWMLSNSIKTGDNWWYLAIWNLPRSTKQNMITPLCWCSSFWTSPKSDMPLISVLKSGPESSKYGHAQQGTPWSWWVPHLDPMLMIMLPNG